DLGYIPALQLAGANDRGSLFGNSIDFLSGLFEFVGNGGEPTLGFPTFNPALIEVDPRSNYFANIWTWGQGGLQLSSDTVIAQGFDSSILDGEFYPEAIAYVDGRVIIGASSTPMPSGGGGEPRGASTINFLITFNPTTQKVERIDFAGVDGFVGLSGIGSGGSAEREPLTFIDDERYDTRGFSWRFANMGYSEAVAQSPLFINNFKFQYLLTSTAAQGGIVRGDSSIALLSHDLFNVVLPQALIANADVERGVARAIFSLREHLPPGHPGQLHPEFGGPELSFLYADYFNDFSIHEKHVVQNFSSGDIDLPSFGRGYPELGGLATRTFENNEYLIYLDGGSYYAGPSGSGGEGELVTQYYNAYNDIWLYDPTAAPNRGSGGSGGTGAWFYLGFFDSVRDDFTEPNVPERESSQIPILTGLAAFEGKDYAVAGNQYPFFSSATPEIRARLYELDYSTYQMVVKMDLGMQLLGGLAAAEDRGSLFLTGQLEPEIPNARGNVGDGRFNFNNLVVAEVDPRNNYVKNTWWGGAGDFASFPSQINNVGDLSGATIRDVSGAAYVDGAFVMQAGLSYGGRGYSDIYISMNPNRLDGGNTPTAGDPFVMRVDSAASYSGPGLSGHHEDSPATAPGPVVLSNVRPSEVDFRGINNAFARLSYSPEALRSGVLQAAFKTEFVRGSINPQGCQTHALLMQIGPKFIENTNMVNGVARVNYSLRHDLPELHPCYPAPAAVAPGGGAGLPTIGASGSGSSAGHSGM
ncbi:MAG TPA: hypothetical protein VG797_08415, partial [Phycisphaerales bacterium]|nr:hypothetical protein [Phycisphaerales bacterium]